tara:strand:+ start:1734 stop:2378 length:645 start_codon:yes stop_codon:yes gene_type:complete
MKKNITIAETLRDITLQQWQDLVLIEEPSNEQVVALFSSLSGADILELPSHIYNIALDNAINIINLSTRPVELTMRFNMGGVEYGMIPNLDKISYGENKDLVAMLGSWETMHKAMAVLYRPIVNTRGDTYSIEKYKGVDLADTMKQMPIDVVIGAKVFFYRLTNALLKCIPNYLEKVIQKELEEQTHNQTTKENGEAMMKLSHSLRVILDDLMK